MVNDAPLTGSRKAALLLECLEPAAAARVLDHLDSETRSTVTRLRRQLDPVSDEERWEVMGEFLAEIEPRATATAPPAFSFHDLVHLDDQTLQRILMDVEAESLVTALRGADQALKSKALANMAPELVEQVQTQLSQPGPVRLANIDTAQEKISRVVEGLVKKGFLVLTENREVA